jgi:hypothetical protein
VVHANCSYWLGVGPWEHLLAIFTSLGMQCTATRYAG